MKHFSGFVAKIKGLSKASLIMLGVGVCSITLAITSIGVGFGIQNAQAHVVDDQNPAPLFARSVENNNVPLMRQLLSLASVVKITAGAPFASAPNVKFANARDIAEANSGTRSADAPAIRLFESFSSSVGGNAFVPFRLVTLTYPGDGGDPIFTFYASELMFIGRFGGTTTYPEYEKTTGGGEIRRSVLNMVTVMGHIPNFNSLVATPLELPYPWYDNQSDGASGINNSLKGDAVNDIFWVPSLYEVNGNNNGMGETGGIFSLSRSEIYGTNSSTGNSAVWLRTAHSAAGGLAMVMEPSSSSSYSIYGTNKDGNHAVRAAVNIRGSALRALIDAYDLEHSGGDDNGGDDGDGGEVVPGTPGSPIVPDYKEQSQKGLSAGAIGEIIGGSLVAVGGATCLTIYLIYRRRLTSAK